LSEKLGFLFRKGMIDVILYLGEEEEAGYYETYKQGYVVSRQTFSKILKQLEEKELAKREVVEDRPPRVYYSLTEKGEEVKLLLESLIKII
jgi:DNA-binding HxlR family transcriptional regulator